MQHAGWKLSIGTLVVLVAWGCAQQEQPSIRAAGASPLPQKTWTGQWSNRQTREKGEVTVTVMEYPGAAYVTYQATGDPLGCGIPLSGSLYLEEGVDFTRAGLALSQPDPVLGALDLVARKRGKRIRGGSDDACNGLGPDYSTRTKVGKVAVSGKVLLHPDAGGAERTTFRVKLCKTCGLG